MVIKLHHALIGFLIFALTLSVLRNFRSLRQNLPFVDELKKEYEHERTINRKLKLDYAKSQDPFEMERVLRDKLGYVKKDEKVLLFKNTSPTVSPRP